MEKFAKTKKTICSFCFNPIRGSNFLELKDDVKAVLDILQLKLIKEENNKLLICNACSVKLFSAFNFKAVCMDTEDYIFPYVISAKGTLVDLRDVYLEKRDKEHLKDLLQEEKICRLCMHVITSVFTSVKDMDNDMLSRYIPEINFNITKEPVICEACFESLNTHTNFLRSCLNVEKTIKNMCKDNIEERLPFIKQEDDEIENKHEDCSLKKIPYFISDISFNIAGEELHGSLVDDNSNVTNTTSDTFDNRKKQHNLKRANKSPRHHTKTKKLKRDLKDGKTITDSHTKSPVKRTDPSDCDFQPDQKVRRLIKSKTTKNDSPSNPPQAKIHVCDVCGYETKAIQAFRFHRLKHGACPDLPTLECKECDYKTQRSCNFDRHVLTHKGFQEGRVFKCKKCPFQTRTKQNLARHQLTHVDLSKTPTYKCDVCGMETIHKYNFKKHQKSHKDRSKVSTFKCEECDFETIHKCSLENHVLRHKNPVELETYKCHLCDYTTVSKACLASHRYKHKASASYECGKCGYKSKNKGHLARHLLTHKKKSEKPVYQCDECGFSTSNRDSFKGHQNHHRDVSQGITHKCDKCGLETAYRDVLRRHQKTLKCSKKAAKT